MPRLPKIAQDCPRLPKIAQDCPRLPKFPPKNRAPILDSIDVASSGQRIDNYLLKRLKRVPKSHLYKLIRKGQLRVNGKRVKPEYKLCLEDIVRIPPLHLAEEKPGFIPPRLVEKIESSVLFENSQLLVIDKPAGVPVHRGSGVDFGIIDVLKRWRQDTPHWSLVHRLDRDTSGCLLIARDRQILLTLQDMFRQRTITKQYLALTVGHWQRLRTTIDISLRKNTLQDGKRLVEVDADGKPALSHFQVMQEYQNTSLTRVSIETGRTHQIRVHAQSAGHPLAGDLRYGDRAFNKSMRKTGLKRLFLHAYRLQFFLGENIDIQCPLPDNLQQVLDSLPPKDKQTNGQAPY